MDGLIRKIVIGRDPKNALAYFVGMAAGTAQVSVIQLDEEFVFRTGKTRYYIFLQYPDGSQVLWKTIDDMPCIVEYDLNF
jgi:hypothetical protein